MKTVRVLPLLILSVVMLRSAAAAEPDVAGFAGGNIPSKSTIDLMRLQAILGTRAAQVKDGVVAAAGEGERARFVSVGRFALRGVGHARELLTLDPDLV